MRVAPPIDLTAEQQAAARYYARARSLSVRLALHGAPASLLPGGRGKAG